MVDDRLNRILSIIIIIVLIGLFIVLGFWGYDVFQKYYIKINAEKFVNELDQELGDINIQENNDELDENEIEIETEIENNVDEEKQDNIINETNNTVNTVSNSSNHTETSSQNNTGKVQRKYKGFNVSGKIEIPKTKLKYPVLSVATVSSMKISVGIVYGPGLNQIGNTVLMGHNYRNGALFSNNKKLQVGDKIYITDMTGKRLRYKIYKKYITSSTDFDYATRSTDGRREITMASCTDDSKSRLIIWAKEA